MAISVVAQVPGLTAEEDAALVEALDLECSPPAGGKIRLDGRRAAAGASWVFGTATQTTSVSVTTGSCPRSGASAARCR